ncbi:MAG: Mur ligase family protein, partial [Patescibacteria group bacterium]
MKKFLKKIIPGKVFLIYHYLMAFSAALYYNFPSKKIIVIGITGTKGKTSTANFIWSCLTAGGYKTGIITTANIRIGEKEVLNEYHMTMPGCFKIQKLIAQMRKDNCKFCIIETTSEGIKQSRHIGIDYDIIIFTNLSPEHLQSHNNNFEEYKKTKAKIFKFSATNKIINKNEIEKIIIANKDSEYADYFLNNKGPSLTPQVVKKITFAMNNDADHVAKNIIENNDSVNFELNEKKFKINILGKFNIYNALPAIIISKIFNIKDEKIKDGLNNLKIIPGRMEEINLGQDFKVFVDK